MKPRRVQLSRRKGSRLPPNTVVVARPSAWGNPFRIGARGIKTNADAVRRFQKAFWMTEVHAAASIVLRGKNLACWCRLGEPCHADVLLAMANGGGL